MQWRRHTQSDVTSCNSWQSDNAWGLSKRRFELFSSGDITFSMSDTVHSGGCMITKHNVETVTQFQIVSFDYFFLPNKYSIMIKVNQFSKHELFGRKSLVCAKFYNCMLSLIPFCKHRLTTN